jgi:tetratricopeptide (TPR) repeat protein
MLSVQEGPLPPAPAGDRLRRLLFLLIALLLAGCAGRRPAVQGPLHEGPKRSVQPEALRIVGGVDALTGLDGYDAADLFRLGYEAYEAEDYARGRALYERLLAEFPESPDALTARWNAALCAEKVGDLEAAQAGFGLYADAVVDPVEATVARIRRARVLHRLGRYQDSVPMLEAALGQTGLDREQRWEARMLRAIARADAGEFTLSESILDGVRREIRRDTLQTGERHPYPAAMVWVMAGDLYRIKAAREPVDMVDDLPGLDRALQRKAQLLLEARQHYKRALQQRIAAWSGAAALGLGVVYEDFRRDLLAAPVPSDFDEEHAAVYTQLLEQRTRAFLEKAATDYREVLGMADRLELEPAWRDVVQDALNRCEEQLGLDRQANVRPAPPGPGGG